MHIVGIIQARMGSSRLPGKVLRRLDGRTVLSRVVRAAQESGTVDHLVIATTTQPADDQVVEEAERLGVPHYRGSADDVLSRFLGALDLHPGESVMRFTADCPLLDPDIIALVGRIWRAERGLDYLSTSLHRSLPRGMDVEVIAADTLRRIGAAATGYHRTHVTSYVYTHPEQFRILGVTFLPDHSDMRLTLDTEDDWRLIETVVRHFGDSTVSLHKLTEWLRANPSVLAINAHVRQKALEDA